MLKQGISILLLIFMALLAAVVITGDAIGQESGSGAIITGVIELTPRESLVRGGGRYGRPVSTNTQASTSNDSILVWLESGNLQDGPQTGGVIILDQIDIKFSPSLLPVQQYGTVRVRNSDPVYHNVFSLSSTKRFDVGRRPKGEYLDVKFDKTGIVDVFCDIHSNMRATIVVLPPNGSTWMKIKNGDTFTFSDLPPGNFQLKAFAIGYSETAQAVSVVENEVNELGTITLDF